MADLLQQGAEWLGRMRRDHLSHLVTYSRDGAELQIAATVGSTTFEVDDGYGGVEKWQSRDYLVTAADLALGGVLVQPQRGDRISDGGQVYEVMAPGKEDVCRPADNYGLTWRIHTKRIGTD